MVMGENLSFSSQFNLKSYIKKFTNKYLINMKKTIVILLLCSVSKFTIAQDSIINKLDELMTAYANTNKFNGSVLIAQHGNILLEKGYGFKNAAGKKLNDSNTIFQIASITKQFTATVVLKLIELNKISLNDKLSKY